MTGGTPTSAQAEEHVRRHRPAAEAGDPAAMAALAWGLLQQGDDSEAELWYARAADAGSVTGMTGLGYLLNRRGALNDAAGWWRRAAAAGDVYAMRNLANALRAQDPAEAERWGFLAAAADHDVAGETVPDDVAAAAAGLGELRSVTGKEEPDSNVGCLISGVAVGGVLALIGVLMLASGATTGWAVGLTAVGSVLALGTLALVAANRENVTFRVWRYEQGLVHRDSKGRLDVLRWTDIRVLRDITRTYRDRHYVGTTYRYTLWHKDGHELVLADALFPRGQMCVLGEAIEREVAAVRLPRALAALEAGKRLDFGDLAVDLDGISNGHDHLPWREVESVDTRDGSVRVQRAGRWLKWSSTRVRDIPDVIVLLTLVDALRALTQGAPR